jgi:hypothetical protein
VRNDAAAFLALLAHGARITPAGRRRAGEMAEAMREETRMSEEGGYVTPTAGEIDRAWLEGPRHPLALREGETFAGRLETDLREAVLGAGGSEGVADAAARTLRERLRYFGLAEKGAEE